MNTSQTTPITIHGAAPMKTIITTVLEYAESDLDEAGYPLLIAIREENQIDSSFHLFILRHWKEILPFTNDVDVEYIEDLIHELRQQEFRLPADRDGFFRSIERLSRGPLRVSLSVSLDQSTIEALSLQTASQPASLVYYDKEVFDEVLQAISRQTGPQVVFKAKT